MHRRCCSFCAAWRILQPGIVFAVACELAIIVGSAHTTGVQVIAGETAGFQPWHRQDGDSTTGSWRAFRPLVRQPAPSVDDPRWTGSPIDAFIKQRLDERGLVPARRADRRVLIRRVYLDLIGLLPEPEEVAAFVADQSADALQRLVDRLLASPHYGERWGRHWLDVARYADSGGYEQDYDYPHAWRYRDYVIRAFNEDKPYDRFVLEQLAGDELDETSFDGLIATGFNRVGPRVGFREKDNPQYRYDYLDDLIGTTSQAFMGLTVQCARCHDHKFDPIAQMDYYRMMAIFFPYVDYDFPLVSREQAAESAARRAEIEALVEPLRRRVAEIERPAREAAFDKRLDGFPKYIQVAVRTPAEKRTPGQQLLAEQMQSLGPGNVRAELSFEDRAEVTRLRREISGLQRQLPNSFPLAMGIRDGDFRFAPPGPGDLDAPGTASGDADESAGAFLPDPAEPYVPPKTYFLPTGDYRVRGPEVQPGFPEVLLTGGRAPTSSTPSNGQPTSGRRRALAEWIASVDHPLTARVLVNRLWQHHFGRGIVSTPNNFGLMGGQPTHPELLDWLASEFMRTGWSIKRMQRLIVTSEVYQMASDHFVEVNARLDPTNNYLYRFPQRRLEAEVIRDIVLLASGNLNRQTGGKPFFPPVPEEVRQAVAKGIWNVTEDGPEVWRRSVYSYYKRGMRYPMFEVLDQPDPNFTCERRDVTTVPTQALTLLNSAFVLKQAARFAERIHLEAGSRPEAQVRAVYRIALSREPTGAELEVNTTFLRRQWNDHAAHAARDPALAALTDLCHVMFNLSEFVYLE